MNEETALVERVTRLEKVVGLLMERVSGLESVCAAQAKQLGIVGDALRQHTRVIEALAKLAGIDTTEAPPAPPAAGHLN